MARVEVMERGGPAGVSVGWVRGVAERAIGALKIRGAGVFSIALLDRRTMARLNRRYTGHEGLTDVLSFRYLPPSGRKGGRVGRRGAGERDGRSVAMSPDNEPTIGEIVISPAFARQYAKAHGLSYRQELARYVIHGLLHWVGHDDRTPAQQRRMRQLEDQLLAKCAR